MVKKAKAAHNIWAHWMKYMFTVCGQFEEEVIIDAEQVEKWKRLMNTKFEDLSDAQKESDFKIAEQYLNDL